MTLLEQRIRARDWANVAKIEGRSIDAVRNHYEAANPSRIVLKVPEPTTRETILSRLVDLGWTRKDLSRALGYNDDWARKVLAGESNLTPDMIGRINAVLRHAEATALRERAA